MKRKSQLLIVIFILIIFPKQNFGQVPVLGVDSTFALFTAAGAFGNVGATNITGDIGTNVGTVTGSPIVNGLIQIANSVSAQAATDVDAAYNFMNGIICDSIIGTTLGNNQVLTKKVYCLGAATTINGNLILDALGDPNALFIFKINGALSTSSVSHVELINSASPLNVYWQVNGAVDLGDSSVFRGTIIANGAINLLDGATLFGRGLTRSGAISLKNNLVNMQPNTPLPIELMNFDAKTTGRNVQLDWSTATETNNNYFTVQHSQDGINFEEVQKVSAAGNSMKVLYYFCIDSKPYEAISYYRLKQTDFDGTYTYSNLVVVDFEKEFTANIYPNPFNGSITITMGNDLQIKETLFRIYNTMGVQVMSSVLKKPITSIETKGLSSGIYFYKVTKGEETIQSGRLVSQ